jgi:hypothetical protein
MEQRSTGLEQRSTGLEQRSTVVPQGTRCKNKRTGEQELRGEAEGGGETGGSDDKRRTGPENRGYGKKRGRRSPHLQIVEVLGYRIAEFL